MRLTVVSPGGATDVEVDDGVPVARLRRLLARLTGDAAWLTHPVTADGVPLPDEHTAGLAPLRHGATLRPGPCPPPDAVLAARAPLHVAVVGGPDTGALVVPGGPGTLGPGGRFPVVDDEPWLVLVRPAGDRLSGSIGARGSRSRLLECRPHPTIRIRRTTSPAWLVSASRLLGRPSRPTIRLRRTTSPACLVSARGRPRQVPRRRWTTWRPGEVLWAGSSTLALRGATAGRARPRLAWARWSRILPALAGATTSAVLATTMHQPVLLLGALSALVLVGPRGEPTPAAPGPLATPLDLAGLRIALAAPRAAGSLAAWPAASARTAPPVTSGSAVTGAAWPVPTAAPSAADVLQPVTWEAGLAVVGPRPAALAAARGILLAALASNPGTPVALRTDRPEDWSWLAWFATVTVDPPGCGERSSFVVLDDTRAAVTGAHRVLTIAPTPPAWSASVLTVDGRSARLTGADGQGRAVPLVGVSTAVADALARDLSARPTDDRIAGCPLDVRLGDLPGVPPPDAAPISERWRQATGPPAAARPGFATPIGAAAGGTPVVVDLVRDGPHAIVAGTTGSGKSELLATLVLGLALAHPPDRLAVLLVDFKGATGLPPALAGLPHVVGHLSDLDAIGARRTLRGLAAELRRRERVLAANGARDLADLDPAEPGTPPRLLVVVDEFRALADDLPDLLPSLARLAAQGRSLGVHLVLATQRPAGAVPSDLRANVALRVVLRVADPGDCSDLVGVPDAAGFDRPGLALLARGPGRPETLQVARAAPRRPRPPVRLADPWPPAGPGLRRWTPDRAVAPARPDDSTAAAWALTADGTAQARPEDRPAVAPAPPGESRATAQARPDDGPEAWVAAIRAAAADRPSAAQPWLPPLPGRVLASDVPAGPGLPLALADLPDDLARGPVRWDPETGHVLVLGGPGSGRSTTLAAVASAALAEGRAVHAIGLPPTLLPRGVASALDADDVTRVARLIRLLAAAQPSAAPRPVLLVDDVPVVLAGLAPLARGAASDAVEQLWASAGGPVAVVAAGPVGPATQRLAPFFADRLVLGSPDPTADLLAGVPTALAGPRPEPGRAIHIGRNRAALCQVALPCLTEPASEVARGPGVRPLPDRVTGPLPAPPQGTEDGPLVPIGRGGDDAGVVAVDLSHPLLVVGPPGSGRSTALDALTGGARAAGLRVVELRGPEDLEDEALLVVDDLDELEARHPTLADALAVHLASRSGVRLIAATTTAHAVAAFRGPVPALVRARRLLVLDLVEPGACDLLGPEGPWLVDPRRHPPGRGALRVGRDVVPLQVAGPA